jgi:hypothetical protein
MNGTARSHKMSNASLRDLTPNELVHLIRKLRWMGLTDEAARLESPLSEVSCADSVLAGPIDTD